MKFIDIIRLADKHMRRFADRLNVFRGTPDEALAKFGPWPIIATYQQAQIENLQRNVRRLFELAGADDPSMTFDSSLIEIAGTDPMKDTLPVAKHTHEAEFHAFIMETRDLLWSFGDEGMNATPKYDRKAKTLAQKLFGRPYPSATVQTTDGSIREQF